VNGVINHIMLALDSLVKRYILKLDEPMHGGRYYLHTQDQNKCIIDFSTSVNPLGASQHVIKAIIDNLIGNSNSITEYPDPHARMLRSSISKYIGIDEDYILVGNGSSEIIYTLADVFIKEDDNVAIVEPTFLEYARACKKNGATIKHIMMSNLKLDYDSIEENIINDNDIKMLFICNPNNPTGILTDGSIILKVIEYCYNKGIVVVLDECFIEFTDEQGYASKVKEFDNLVVIRSLTKAFGLAGLRIGYCVSDPRIVKVLSKAKVPWSVNAIAQIAGIKALSDLEHLNKSKSFIMKEKRFLINHLRCIQGVNPLESDTNFFLLRLEGFNSKVLRDALLSKGILVRDCSNFYGMNNSYIRISTRLRDDNITLIDAIKSIL